MSDKEQIKSRILNAASKMFKKYGFSNARTEDLAKELGISKRTLYEHFSSKEALFKEFIQKWLKESKKSVDEIVNRITASEKVDFMAELKKLWNLNSNILSFIPEDFFEDIRKNLPEVWEMILKFREEQIKTNFKKLHSIGVKKGFVKPEVNQELLYLIHYHSINSIIMPEVIYDLPLSSKEVCESILDVLLTGVLTEKGKNQYLKK